MTTISFEIDQRLERTLEQLAHYADMPTADYLKSILIEELRKELPDITENSFEVAILA